MKDIQVRQSSPEESHRWGAYLARRKAAVCNGTPLREGFRLVILPSFEAQRCWTVEFRP